DQDKEKGIEIARKLSQMGFTVVSTRGTAEFLQNLGIHVEKVNKVREGRPHIVDRILNSEIHLVMNTTQGKQSIKDSYSIRRTALEKSVPYFTTIEGSKAATEAIAHIKEKGLDIVRLQP